MSRIKSDVMHRIAQLNGVSSLSEAAQTKKDLTKIAEKIADETVRAINKQTPSSVKDMPGPYARQFTLEEVIRILKDLV